MDKRRSFSDKMKFEVVLEVLKGQRTMAEIASQFEVHPIQVGRWKKEFLERGPSMFSSGKSAAENDWACCKASDDTSGRAAVSTQTMRALGNQSLELLLRAPAGVRGDDQADEPHRRDLHQQPGLRQQDDAQSAQP